MGAVVLVESAFTVDAVKTAHLASLRQKIDAQGDAQTSAVYGPEDGRRINDGTHMDVPEGVMSCRLGRQAVLFSEEQR